MKDDGYVLPLVVHPPKTRCFKIDVPDERYYIAAFLGQLWELTRWYNWKQDEAHTALQVAAVWKQIFTEVLASTCDNPLIAQTFGEDDENMTVLYEPYCKTDGTCGFHFRCDICGNWHDVVITSDISANPSGAGNQPAPGGGSASYCKKLFANQTTIIPTLVKTGDTIQIVSYDGAGSDGTVDWFCADGNIFAISCTTFGQHINGTDPLHAAGQFHMNFIVNLGGTFYPLYPYGTPLVVPAGYTGVQPIIQVNDLVLNDNSGDYDICVQVVNNSVATVCHNLDFTISPYGFVPDTREGFTALWAAGIGWYISGSTSEHLDVMFVSGASFTVTAMDYECNTGGVGGGASGAAWYMPVPTIYPGTLISPLAAGPNHASGAGTVAGTTIAFSMEDGTSTALALTSLKITIQGFDPFAGTPLC